MASIIQKKRLANEVKLLANQPLHYCTAYPDESNPLIWYFLIKGQRGTDYHTSEKNSEGKFVGGEGGEYIGKIVHSPKYPAEPPDYYMLTPSGRYNVGSKICLTNSSYHKGDWSSTWNILLILIAFYSIWLDDKEHGISHITDTPANRKRMASESIAYNLKNNRAIYEKFDRSHLKDDDPVVLKKKVVSDEEQAKQVEQFKQEQQAQQVQPTQQVQAVEENKEMKVMKELIMPPNPPIQVNQTNQTNQVKAKVIVEEEDNDEDEVIEPVKAKRGRKPKAAK
jgi:ubiquitin-protein ligase